MATNRDNIDDIEHITKFSDVGSNHEQSDAYLQSLILFYIKTFDWNPEEYLKEFKPKIPTQRLIELYFFCKWFKRQRISFAFRKRKSLSRAIAVLGVNYRPSLEDCDPDLITKVVVQKAENYYFDPEKYIKGTSVLEFNIPIEIKYVENIKQKDNLFCEEIELFIGDIYRGMCIYGKNIRFVIFRISNMGECQEWKFVRPVALTPLLTPLWNGIPFSRIYASKFYIIIKADEVYKIAHTYGYIKNNDKVRLNKEEQIEWNVKLPSFNRKKLRKKIQMAYGCIM